MHLKWLPEPLCDSKDSKDSDRLQISLVWIDLNFQKLKTLNELLTDRPITFEVPLNFAY